MSHKPQLRMWRASLDGLPDIAMPEGYGLRHYQPGDGLHWERIIGTSFEADPGRFSFDRIMRAAPCYRPERVWFIVKDREPVATASAWYHPERFPEAGTIHYVGVLPGHQGRSLGYWVSLAAMQQMVREGRRQATLLTDDFRLPALSIYLSLGFGPLLVHENQRDRWRAVFEALGLPGMTDRYADRLNGPLWSPPEWPHDDFEYRGLVRTRRRHHPGRPPGRPTVGECDALGDESLYRPSQLGRAGIVPDSVTAGSDQPFDLWFEAGPRGLPARSEVLFYTLGQNPLGTPPQWDAPAAPGYIELQYGGGAEVFSLRERDRRGLSGPGEESRVPARGTALGFRLGERALQAGERVTLSIGKGGGFRWTPLAGRKVFNVLVNPGFGEAVMRLPEPVVMTVVSECADQLEVLAPATACVGDRVPITVRVRDCHDNRVFESSRVRLSCAGEVLEAELPEGFGRILLPGMPGQVAQWRAEAPGLPVARSNPTIPRQAGEQQLFFGDLHVHDMSCAAEGYTGDVYAWARDEKRLDFVSVSPQCHAWIDNEVWAIQKHFCEAFLEEGRFLTFPAFEWQHSHYGDKVIHYLGGDQPYLPVDDARFAHPAALYEALRASDALVIGHHPGYALDLHVPGTDWDAVAPDVERLVELWSMHGSSEGFRADDCPLRPPRREGGVMEALQGGLRLGFTAGSDTHSGRPGGSAKEPRPYWGGLCAVWAGELTRRGLFEALYARRTYAVRGRRTVLRFTVNDAPMGSEIASVETRCIRVQAWAPISIACVDILRDARSWQHVETHGCHVEQVIEDRGDCPAFYHARVTLQDGSLSVCSPVWVG